MPGELIEDFRRGLDARKFKLNAPAGTLTTLENAHITPGGEIEKRKAWSAPELYPGCFGMEVVAAGFLTFGSGSMAFATTTEIESAGDESTLNAGFGFAVPVGTKVLIGDNSQGIGGVRTVTASTADSLTVNIGAGSGDGSYAETPTVTLVSFPCPVTGEAVSYQRLQHPDGATAMTKVVHSTVFNGKAFVIAQFGTDSFAYYDGTLVADFISGLVKSWLNTNALLAANLSSLLNTLGSFSSSSLSNVVTVTSPAGITTSLEVQKDTTAGTLLANNTVTQVDGLDGVAARGQFTVKAGNEVDPFVAGTNAVTSVYVGAAGELLPASVDWQTSNEATAAAIKDAINTRQTAPAATTIRARTSGTATLIIGAHKFKRGDKVTVSGLTNAVTGDYNAAGVTILSAGATDITYTNAGSNEAGTADTGGVVTMVARAFAATVNDNTVILTANTEGVTPSGQQHISVTAVGAVCIGNFSFAITQASDTAAVPTVNGVYVNGVNQLGTPVTGADIEAVAAAVAAAIVATGNYLAAAVGNVVYISRKITMDTDTALAVIVVVAAGGGVITTPSDTLVVTLGPENATLFSGVVDVPISLTNFIAALHLSVQVSGGLAPYSYKWTIPTDAAKYPGQKFSATTASGLCRVDVLPTDTEVSPQLKFNRGTSVLTNNWTGFVTCTVTDSAGRKATGDLKLTASFYPYT